MSDIPSHLASGNPLTLDEFPPSPAKAWRAVVESELKGVPFEKKLVTKTIEGIALQPIYTAADSYQSSPQQLPGFFPYLRGTTPTAHVAHGWEISQELVYGNPREFNAAARTDLARGLTAVNLNLDAATRAGKDPDTASIGEVGRGGVSIATIEDLARALDGIDLQSVPFFIRTGASALPFAALLFAHLRKRNISPALIRGCIEMDPLGVLSHEGELSHSLEDSYKEMAHLTSWSSAHAPQVQTICVHGRPYHESGANAAQELAFALATGAEYLRALGSRDITPDIAAPRIRFSLSVGPRFFVEIAKLRASRILWARIVKAFGGSDEAARIHLHARTSQYTKTLLDPYVNMLRVTVEAFAAAVGGCDSMHTAPFDEVIRPADEFSRRIARNTQLILSQESNLHRIIDAAGGSWYIENLTQEIAKKAWSIFQEVEKKGGMAKALVDSWPQQEISSTAAARAEALAQRRNTLVGTNLYPNATEQLIERKEPDYAEIHRIQARRIGQYRISQDNRHNTLILHRLAAILDSSPHNLLEAAISAAESGATLGEITRTLRSNSNQGPMITPVNIHRLAEPFERIRLAAAKFESDTGTKPRAFCCNLGGLKQHKARSDFSKAFLEVGGFEVLIGPGATSPSEAADQVAASAAPVIVICSTDDTYPELVPPLIEAIRDRGIKSSIVLAGFPQDQVETLRAAGVDEFLHIRANALVLLKTLLLKAGVKL